MVPCHLLNNNDPYQLASHTNQGELYKTPQIIKCSASHQQTLGPNPDKSCMQWKIVWQTTHPECRFSCTKYMIKQCLFPPLAIVTPGIHCTSLNLMFLPVQDRVFPCHFHGIMVILNWISTSSPWTLAALVNQLTSYTLVLCSCGIRRQKTLPRAI